MSGLSGLNGSVPGVELSINKRIPRPMPPMYCFAISSVNGSVLICPVVRLTRRIFPA